MRATRWWWGMLCVAGMACGDEGPMGARTVREVGRDLEFVLPAVRDLGPVFRREVNATALQSREVSVSEGTERESIFPFFTSKYLTAVFNGSILTWYFGFSGYGTGYTIVPEGTVLKADGSPHMSGLGGGVSYDFAIPLGMMGDWNEFAGVGQHCGLYTNFDGSFAIRTSLAGVQWLPTMQIVERLSTIAYQPACQTDPSGGGGGTVTSTSNGLKICYWEVHADIDGNVVEVLPLGCYPISVT